MIPIIEFQERALTGQVMKSDEFDLEFAMKVRDLATRYDIQYNPEELIVDDDTADAVFQAGVELLSDIGLYHLDTERVIKFAREEVEEIAREYRENPSKHTFGRGKDEVTVAYRTSTDSRPPTLYAGSSGVAQQEWFASFVQSFAQEKSIEAMGICAGLGQLGNIKPKAGTLSEIHVGLWEQARMREVLERVDRPGMHCGLLATVSSAAGTMAMIGPGLREAHNTQIGVHIIPEQKLNWNQLLMAQFCRERGIQPWQSAMSMLGGLCRNAAEAAVGIVANMLGQLAYANGQLCSVFSSQMDGKSGTAPTLWAMSAAARAAERNIKVAIGGCPSALPLSKTPFILLQTVTMAAVYTGSGMAYSWIAGNTGIEARYAGEAMKAIAGMERNKANELANALMNKTAEHVNEVKGNRTYFTEVYDVESVQPRPDFIDILERAKEELGQCGVPYR